MTPRFRIDTAPFCRPFAVIVLTDGWRKNPGLKEMFMPYMFGVLYVLLGFSYLLGNH